MPQPPFRPNYLQAANYVTDMWAQPCDVPWYIYAETLWPAALKALITLATFGWDDVFRGYVRPKGLRARKFKKKPFRIKGIPLRFPELGELIGRKLPGVKRMQNTKYVSGTASLWRMDGVLQRGLFYWLLADIAVDFTFNWTSALYETEWCKADALSRHSNRTIPFQLGAAGGSWNDLNCPTEEYNVGDIAFAQHSWTMPNNHCRFGGAALFHDHIQGGGQCRLRLIETVSRRVHSLGAWTFWDTAGEARPMVIGRSLPNVDYTIQWSAITPDFLVKVSERTAFAAVEIPHFEGPTP